MFDRLSSVEKIAVIVATGIFSALTVSICLGLKVSQTYSDFIVGHIAWNATTKFQDIVIGPAVIVVSSVGLILFSMLLNKLKKRHGDGHSEQLASQLIWWSIPGIAGIVGLFLRTGLNTEVLVFSAVPIIVVSVISIANHLKKIKINIEIVSIFIISVIFISLVPLEVYLAVGRMTDVLLGDNELYSYVETASVVIFLSGAGLIFYCGIINGKTQDSIVRKIILAAQLGLPFLFLLMYPAKLVFANGDTTAYDTAVFLRMLVAVAILAGVFDVIRRYLKNTKSGELKALFSPVAIFAIIVLLKYGSTLPPSISQDDYHFGERLLGWWSYAQGTIPYLDYIPSHGVVNDDLFMFLSSIFYDGTASSINQSSRLGLVILSFVAFLSILNFSKSLKLSFFVILFLPVSVTWTFFLIFLCLFFNEKLINIPSKWLIAWMVSAPIIILAVPGQGLLLVVASGIMATRCAWIQWRDGDKRSWIAIGVTASVLLIVAASTPLGGMLFSAIRYVLENGPINQLAYGIPWDRSLEANKDKGLMFVLVQMAWMTIAILCATIIYSKRKELKNLDGVVYPVITVFLFILLLIPYSMGRIDPNNMSRAGSISFAGWVMLLPLAVWPMINLKNKAPLFLLMACVFALFPGFFINRISYSGLFSAVSPTIRTPPLRSGQSVGLDNVGNARVENEHWEQLVKLNALFNAKLSPDETYLDLTSRNAQYFYLNRKPVVEVTAPYNMVSPSQQKRVVERLSENPPPLALLQARNIVHDGGGLALRSPILYRFVIDNYSPSFEDGFIIGYRRTHDEESTINAAIKNFTDGNWDRGLYRRGNAVILDDSNLNSFVEAGDYIRIGGESRRIREVWKNGLGAVWFEGRPVVLADIPDRNSIKLIINPQRAHEYEASLFQKALATPDLRKLPVSWGRSERSLQDKMILVGMLDDMPRRYNHVVADNDTYKVTGNDPFVRMDISEMSISGRDAGLLKFDFTCHGQRKEPRVQIFWWGDNHYHPFEASSLKFTAETGTLIVPLDSSPLWLMLNSVRGVRIDLHDASACSAFSIENAGLYQRKF